MHFIRVMRSPDHVLVWHTWERAGDAASVRVPAGGERAFVLCQGSLRAYPDPDVRMGAEGQRLLESQPGFGQNGYADVVPPTVFPVTKGGWVIESLQDDTWGFCIVPLTRVALVATFGSEEAADRLLPGGEWDGPYSVSPSYIVPGQMDPRSFGRLIRNVHIVDAELIHDVGLNDLRQKLRELREVRHA